jgi:hypothetical protein
MLCDDMELELDEDFQDQQGPASYQYLEDAQKAKELYIWTYGYLDLDERLVIVGFNRHGDAVKDEYGKGNISENLGGFG